MLPGYSKPPNSGRKKGARKRVTNEITEIAQQHGMTIAHSLVKEFKATDDLDVRVKIAPLVLSYDYGQPTLRRARSRSCWTRDRSTASVG